MAQPHSGVLAAVRRNKEDLYILVWKDLQETVLSGKTGEWRYIYIYY